MITFLCVTMLFWVDYLGIAELSAKTVITGLFILMISSVIGFRAYFWRKPDL